MTSNQPSPRSGDDTFVHDARANGHTWHEIAHALGTSPDDAQLCFDPETPIADNRWPYQP